jgi:iron(III) transport system ATP-binding protein
MTGIALEGLSKRYAGQARAAVNGLSLELPAGTLTSLLGPSGCGKTTVLRLIAGLEAPDAGRVSIGGVDVTAVPSHARGLSLMFQSYALFPHLSVQRNVEFGLRAQGLLPAQAQARASQALHHMGLADAAQRAPQALSGGQQQRVALARALVTEPSVLLFDEPLSNLDTRLRRQMREEIRALQQRLQVTVVYVTHDQAEALAVSDRVVVMQDGRVAQQGTPREVYEQPVDAFVAGFMGDTVLLPATVDAQGRVQLGPLHVQLPTPLSPTAAARTTLTLAVRPHAWRVHPASHPGLPARVLRSTYVGHAAELQVACDLGELLLHLRGSGPRHQAGAPVSLTLGDTGVSVLA